VGSSVKKLRLKERFEELIAKIGEMTLAVTKRLEEEHSKPAAYGRACMAKKKQSN
jgi:hypothetical protein